MGGTSLSTVRCQPQITGKDHTEYKKTIIQQRHLSCHPCRIGLQLLTKLTLVVLVHTIRKGDIVVGQSLNLYLN
jgi:hypothetical protein